MQKLEDAGPRGAAAPAPGGVPSRPDRSATRGRPSAKLDLLLPQLEEIVEEGHKALVFSQFTSFLALAAPRLDARHRLRVPRRQDARPPGARRALPERPGCRALPDQPQGRRPRPQPHRRRLRLPARSVVEPRRRSAGHRPRAPHRPDAPRLRLPPRSRATRSRRRSSKLLKRPRAALQRPSCDDRHRGVRVRCRTAASTS
jgi:hypothetical protein